MDTSEAKRNIYQKLSYIQLNLKAPKNQYNKFGGYNYRNCEDIQEALKPLMNEMSTVLIIGDELVLIGDRYYIKATARLMDMESGEAIENTAYAREEAEKKGMDASQITGSTSSYARKYALNGLFCIDDTKDMDCFPDDAKGGEKNTQDSNKKTAKSSKSKSSPEGQGKPLIDEQQMNALFMEMERANVSKETLLKAAHVDDFRKLTPALYEGLMGRLKATTDRLQSPQNHGMAADMDDGGLPWSVPEK